MTRICVYAIVGQPAATTERLLQEYMNERTRGDGSIALPIHMRLREGRDDLAVSHDVLMRFRRGLDAETRAGTFFIDWEPSGAGPYPSFSGTMDVYAESDPRESRLEINGTYQAPGGALGKIFDALVGRLIARHTLTDLIERIASELTPATSSPTRR